MNELVYIDDDGKCYCSECHPRTLSVIGTRKHIISCTREAFCNGANCPNAIKPWAIPLVGTMSLGVMEELAYRMTQKSYYPFLNRQYDIFTLGNRTTYMMLSQSIRDKINELLNNPVVKENTNWEVAARKKMDEGLRRIFGG